MPLEVLELEESHIEDAAALFVENYRFFKRELPLLPARYGDQDVIISMLADLVRDNPSVAAFEDRRLVGYLSGFVLEDFQGLRTVYSPEWTGAALLGESARIYQDMYSRLAPDWIAGGCCQHLVSLLNHDRDGIQGWVRMGFGMLAFDGLLQPGVLSGVNERVEVRQAGKKDAGQLKVFFDGLQSHMAGAPTYWLHQFPPPQDWLSEQGREMFLAYLDGQPAGCMGLNPGHPDGCDILKDSGTATIEIVYIRPEFRRSGVGQALLDFFQNYARAQGFQRVAVEYESANVTAARFWERWFDPVCCSLLRRIDDRICPALGTKNRG